MKQYTIQDIFDNKLHYNFASICAFVGISEGVVYDVMRVVKSCFRTAFVLDCPENGLHPAKIKAKMREYRILSSEKQVLIYTCNPLVLNELRGDEVIIVTRNTKGSILLTRFCDTPNFIERSKVYALGEMWVSYCNEKGEGPLFLKDK